MERAGRSFAQLKAARACLSREEWALAAWTPAAGKPLAQRTRAVALVRDRIVVEVEDALWQRNLNALRGQILSNYKRLLGEDAPADIEFRIGVPRRPPRVETRPSAAPARQPGLFDEADAIADPMMARIYRMSRRKALA